MPVVLRDKAASLGRMHGNARIVVDATREIRIGVRNECRHSGIQFDGIDTSCAVAKRHQDTVAATGPEQQDVRLIEQLIGQRRRHVPEVCDRLGIAVVARNRTHTVSVREYGELLRWNLTRVETEAGCVPNGHGRAVDHRQQSERAGRMSQHAAVHDLQCLAQSLVLGRSQRQSVTGGDDRHDQEPGKLHRIERPSLGLARPDQARRDECHSHKDKQGRLRVRDEQQADD